MRDVSKGQDNPSRRRALTWLAVGIVVTTSLQVSAARDLDRLIRLLIPAFLVQNFALVCRQDDTKFLSELKNGVGTVSDFSDHVKKEVTIDLPEPEAEQIRLMAANTARAETRTQLEQFKTGNSVTDQKAFLDWCSGSVRPFVVELMRLHEEKHADFERQLDAAKR